MCFGGPQTTKTQTTTLPGYLNDAAQKNVANAMNFASTPFQAYTGEKVAPLTQDQNDAFGMIRSIAGTNNPYLSDIEGLYKTFANTPASSISAPSIIGGGTNVASSTIQDYMSPYIMAAMQPQLQDLERSGVAQRKDLDARATMDGAFGDARSGIERGAQRRNEDILRNNIIGTGYHTAFNTAAGLRDKDISNSIDAQKTNASLVEQALQRAITGGHAFQNLNDKTIDSAGKLADAGTTQQQTKQAINSADMAEFLRGQGWTQQQIAMVTAALAGTPYEKTVETQEPNNSGFGILGAIGGSLFGPALKNVGGALGTSLASAILSDRRLKYDISVIGKTFDGLPIYRFKYVGNDQWQIGLMAQEVESIYPAAVLEVDGVKMVDLEKATQKASDLGAAF